VSQTESPSSAREGLGNDTAVILENRRPIVGYTGGGRMKAVSKAQAATHLFTMRVWIEETDHGRSELRGALTHVLTGKIGQFQDWVTNCVISSRQGTIWERYGHYTEGKHALRSVAHSK
jgi:hypothetical protein